MKLKQKPAKENPWVIHDWAGNVMDFGSFSTEDDAFYFLCEKFDGDENEMQEYYIVKNKNFVE